MMDMREPDQDGGVGVPGVAAVDLVPHTRLAPRL